MEPPRGQHCMQPWLAGSHSWVLVEVNVHVIVIVETLLSWIHLGLAESTGEEGTAVPTVSSNQNKPSRPSLAKIVLSLEGSAAKQQALTHILTALQIMYAR